MMPCGPGGLQRSSGPAAGEAWLPSGAPPRSAEGPWPLLSGWSSTQSHVAAKLEENNHIRG
eukprot:233987-Pyramimonas_sp.AAC.1